MSTNNENKKLLLLETVEAEPFEKLASTTIETTQKLGKRINKIFSDAFVDYHGCYIYCMPGNNNIQPWQQFAIELHFKPITLGGAVTGNGKIRAFKPIEEAKSDDIVHGLKAYWRTMTTSKRFEMTEEAAQILSEFMIPEANIDPWNPNSYDHVKFEYQDQSPYVQTPAMVKVTGLNILALVKKIYGNKTEDGKYTEYGVTPYAPVNQNVYANQPLQSAVNWNIVIMQLDVDKIRDTASELGIISPAGGATSQIIVGC